MTQTVRGFCGVPTASIRKQTPLDFTEYAAKWKAKGRQLFVATANQSSALAKTANAVVVAHVVIADAREPERTLGRPPEKYGPRGFHIWLYRIDTRLIPLRSGKCPLKRRPGPIPAIRPRPATSWTSRSSCPVYNEAEHLEAEVARVRAVDGRVGVLATRSSSSTTAPPTTRPRSRPGIEGIRFINFLQNRGSGSARKAGTKAARGRVTVWTDVDMTYPNDTIPQLVKELEGYDQVVGARTTEEGTVKALRVPAKWLIRKLASFLSGTKIPDLNSGFRAFRTDVGSQYVNQLPVGFSCVTTITMTFLAGGYSVKYIPIEYAKRAGESKFHWYKDTRRYATQVVRMILSYNPLRIFMPVGLGLFAIGFVKLFVDIVGMQLARRGRHDADPVRRVPGDRDRPARRPRDPRDAPARRAAARQRLINPARQRAAARHAIEGALRSGRARRPSRTPARRTAGRPRRVASASAGVVRSSSTAASNSANPVYGIAPPLRWAWPASTAHRRCTSAGRRCANDSVSTIAKLSKYDGCTSASEPASAPLRVGSSTKPVTTTSRRFGSSTSSSPSSTSLRSLGVPLLVRDEVVDQLGRALRGVDPADVEQVRRVAQPVPAAEPVGVTVG